MPRDFYINMSMKKFYLFGIVLILAGIYWFLRIKEDQYYREKGQELILKVEQFRENNGRLPNNISEMGLQETMEAPFYEKKDSIHYIIYFPIGFDNSKIYDSQQKKWKDR